MGDSAKSEPTQLKGEAAFNQVKREIAERNEATQKEARKLRAETEQRKASERRQQDLR